MTHETKAGVLVSVAFVGFVCAVIYLKMTGGDGGPATDPTKGNELPAWPTTAAGKESGPSVNKASVVSAPTGPGQTAPMDNTAPKSQPTPAAPATAPTTHTAASDASTPTPTPNNNTPGATTPPAPTIPPNENPTPPASSTGTTGTTPAN